ARPPGGVVRVGPLVRKPAGDAHDLADRVLGAQGVQEGGARVSAGPDDGDSHRPVPSVGVAASSSSPSAWEGRGGRESSMSGSASGSCSASYGSSEGVGCSLIVHGHTRDAHPHPQPLSGWAGSSLLTVDVVEVVVDLVGEVLGEA